MSGFCSFPARGVQGRRAGSFAKQRLKIEPYMDPAAQHYSIEDNKCFLSSMQMTEFRKAPHCVKNDWAF